MEEIEVNLADRLKIIKYREKYGRTELINDIPQPAKSRWGFSRLTNEERETLSFRLGGASIIVCTLGVYTALYHAINPIYQIIKELN